MYKKISIEVQKLETQRSGYARNASGLRACTSYICKRHSCLRFTHHNQFTYDIRSYSPLFSYKHTYAGSPSRARIDVAHSLHCQAKPQLYAISRAGGNYVGTPLLTSIRVAADSQGFCICTRFSAPFTAACSVGVTILGER